MDGNGFWVSDFGGEPRQTKLPIATRPSAFFTFRLKLPMPLRWSLDFEGLFLQIFRSSGAKAGCHLCGFELQMAKMLSQLYPPAKNSSSPACCKRAISAA